MVASAPPLTEIPAPPPTPTASEAAADVALIAELSVAVIRMSQFWKVVCLLAAILVITPLVAILVYVLVKGLPSLTTEFLFHSAGNTTEPGALNAILS